MSAGQADFFLCNAVNFWINPNARSAFVCRVQCQTHKHHLCCKRQPMVAWPQLGMAAPPLGLTAPLLGLTSPPTGLTAPDVTPAGPDSTPTGSDSTPTGPDSTPTGPNSTPSRPSSTNDDPILDSPACSQSDASVNIPPNGPAVSVGVGTTAGTTGLGMGSEQDGDGAKSSSPSVEPQTCDVAAGPHDVAATVGMTPERDGVARVRMHALAPVRMHALACVVSSSWL